jgi:hypothetical protein
MIYKNACLQICHSKWFIAKLFFLKGLRINGAASWRFVQKKPPDSAGGFLFSLYFKYIVSEGTTTQRDYARVYWGFAILGVDRFYVPRAGFAGREEEGIPQGLKPHSWWVLGGPRLKPWVTSEAKA